jgi:hypothetical protein
MDSTTSIESPPFGLRVGEARNSLRINADGVFATHRLKFLKLIDAQTPAELDLHLIADNYGTHKHP